MFITPFTLPGLYRLAFERSPLCKLLMPPQARLLAPLTQANRSLCRLLGYSQSELLGMSLPALGHPDDRPGLLALAGQVLEGKLPASQLEFRLIHRDGHAIWSRLNLEALRDAEGQISELSGEIQDISQARTLGAARAAELTRLRTAAALAGLGSWDYARASGTLSWSPECVRLLCFRQSVDQLDHSALLNCIHPEDRSRIRAGLAEALSLEQDFALVFRVHHPWGEIRHLRLQGSALKDADGEISGMGGYLIDITSHFVQGHLMQETDRLMQIQRQQLSEVAGLIAAQLKSSLSWIHKLTDKEAPPSP